MEYTIFPCILRQLQEAYVLEKNQYSTWNDIGYKGPGAFTAAATGANAKSESTNFYYQDGVSEATAITTKQSKALTIDGKVKLNDCAATTSGAGEWHVDIEAAAEADAQGGSVTYTAAATNAGCKALTPSFSDIAGYKAATTKTP